MGVVFDPMDYLPIFGSTVMIGGLPRAQAGTACQPMPPSHIPLGGVFLKPPGNESEVFMGSSTVSIDGDAASFMAVPALSCQDVGMLAPVRPGKPKKTTQMVAPLTTVLPIPSTVVIGGAPTVSLAALGGRAVMGAAMKALGGLLNKAKKLNKARKARKAQNGLKCNGLHPVNIVTGEQFDTFLDAQGEPGTLWRWQRYYTRARRREDRGLGYGFRHCWDHELQLAPQAWRFEDWQGREIFFEPLTDGREDSIIHDFRLRRLPTGQPRTGVSATEASATLAPATLAPTRSGAKEHRTPQPGQ